MALLLHVGAAGREGAAGRWVEQVGWPALDGDEPGVARVGDAGHRLEERLGVGHGHALEEDVGRRPLDDVAGVHHDDLVGARGHHAEVVGHEDHGHVAVALQLAQQVEDLRLHCDVEAGGGLVGHEEARGAGQGDGDHHALAHAARELGGVGLVALDRGGDAHLHQQRERGLLGLALGELQVDPERLGDLVADPLHRVERRHRVLEDHGDVRAPELAQLVVRRVEDLGAVVAHRPRLRGRRPREQAHDRPGQHGLARARLAHDAERLALVEGERHALDGLQRAAAGGEGDVEVLDLEQPASAHSLISVTSK